MLAQSSTWRMVQAGLIGGWLCAAFMQLIGDLVALAVPPHPLLGFYLFLGFVPLQHRFIPSRFPPAHTPSCPLPQAER